jgi:pyruvate formate lyase activating enzyme
MKMPEKTSLRQLLSSRTRAAAEELVETDDRGYVRCLACGHRCLVPVGHAGICKVRSNVEGTLLVPWGYVAGLAVDPIEKKPFFHVLPGEDALSFGMMGCDLHCAYCQNWVTSQALRDDDAVAGIRAVAPEEMVALAHQHHTPVLVSTYNEPLITAEWAADVFGPAKEQGLLCGFVSNGNATPQVLRYLRPFVDLYKIDLKSFQDVRYRELGGVLANVLRTVEDAVDLGFWVEVVTLVVPGFNDGDDELRSLARFLAGVSRDIPWHVTAFRPDYKMDDTPATPVETLLRAHAIGKDEGLRFVYAGNIPGRVGDRESTWCAQCGGLLVAREGYLVQALRIERGRCPDCETRVPGIWDVPR